MVKEKYLYEIDMYLLIINYVFVKDISIEGNIDRMLREVEVYLKFIYFNKITNTISCS